MLLSRGFHGLSFDVGLNVLNQLIVPRLGDHGSEEVVVYMNEGAGSGRRGVADNPNGVRRGETTNHGSPSPV